MFDRRERPVRLTPRGRTLLEEVERLLFQARNVEITVQALRDGEAGHVRLGMTAAFASAFGGRGTTGGAVSLVSKKPGKGDWGDVEFTLGSDATRRATLDVNHEVSDTFTVRLNAMNGVGGERAPSGGECGKSHRRDPVCEGQGASPAEAGDAKHSGQL